MPPRTIDNLGIDVSARYAQDKKELDDKIISEARTIPAQTQIDVTEPIYPSEFDALFELTRKNLPWAEFFPPTGYTEQKRRLFTHQMIPSLGTPEKKQTSAERILAKVEQFLSKRQADKDKEGEKDPKKKFLKEKEEETVEKEKKTLIKLFDCIIFLDKDISSVNSKRAQYQKG